MFIGSTASAQLGASLQARQDSGAVGSRPGTAPAARGPAKAFAVFLPRIWHRETTEKLLQYDPPFFKGVLHTPSDSQGHRSIPLQGHPGSFWRLVACSGSVLFLAAVLALQPGLRHQGRSMARLLSGLAGRREPLLLIATDDLPDGSVLELIHGLRSQLGPTPLRVVLFLEDSVERERLGAFSQAGVQALCRLESFSGDQLAQAIEGAAGNRNSLDPYFLELLLRPVTTALRSGCPHQLQPRERQLLRLVAEGYNASEIATKAGIRADTVRRYLSQAYQRIGVRDRAQAVGWCLSHGIVTRQELDRLYRPLLDPPDR